MKKFVLVAWLLMGVVIGADAPPEESLIAAVDNLGPTAQGFSSEGQFGPNEDDYVDPRVLRDFVESKGLISCRQKSGSLTIAGDVRARWICTGETQDGIRMRGFGTDYTITAFKSEINLILDYAAPRSWVATKLKFVNFDGIDGGTSTRVDMERAFIGYDIYEDGDEDFYVEIGRSYLDYLFESRVEFGSIFDGIHLFYTNWWPCVGQFTVHGGPFIIDSYTNHYAWCVEAFVNRFKDTGLSIKYSIIDWFRHAPTLNYGTDKSKKTGDIFYRNNSRYRFVISQLMLGYQEEIDFCRCKTLFLYAAGLVNSAAMPNRQTNYRKENLAWYIGFTLGKLCKACDWSLDINYQYVQAQAVPEFDLCGIGHGNATSALLSDAILYNETPRGLFTNYKGIEGTLLYAMTDTLSLRTTGKYTVPITTKIVGDYRYKAFEMSVIYAF